MQVLGYILGGLFILGLVILTAINIYKLVKAIKNKQEIKKQTTLDEEKGED